MRRSQFLFWLDIALLLLFVVDQEPAPTGLAGHEWIGVALIALLVLHLLVNWRWIVGALRRFRRGEARRSRIATLLNAALFIGMALTLWSGLAISESALPPFGIEPSRIRAWRDFHEFIAGLTEVIVGMHIALNWDWVRTAAKKWRERHHGHGVLSLWSRLAIGGAGDIVWRSVQVLAVAGVISVVTSAVMRGFFRDAPPREAVRVREVPEGQRLTAEARTPNGPDFGELPEELSVQLLIVAASAFGGRKVLRLRL